jgi:hypothetical protein
MFNLNSKKWSLLFCLFCFLILLFIVFINYTFDNTGYFSKLHYGQSAANALSVRSAKITYIKNHPELYTGFIIGGSRTGVLDPAVAEKYTGLSFYNFSFLGSSFEEYEYLTDFLLQKTKVKIIILQLAGIEVLNAKSNYLNIYAINQKISTKLNEVEKLLLTDCKPKIKGFFKKDSITKVQPNGMIEYIDKYSLEEKTYFTYIDTIIKNWKIYEENFFKEKDNIYFRDSDVVLKLMEGIKKKCDDNDVGLIVILSVNSIYDLSILESENYYDFLKKLTQIVSIYNFNGYGEINFNPYNFADTVHYRKEIADKMLSIIFGEEEALNDDWGILLTKENIDNYLKKREEKYYEFKKIFEETGSLPFGTIDDASFIPPYGK